MMRMSSGRVHAHCGSLPACPLTATRLRSQTLLSSKPFQPHPQRILIASQSSTAGHAGDAGDAISITQHTTVFTRVGQPLPEGVRLSAIAYNIPDDFFIFDLKKALLGLALPLSLVVIGYGYLIYNHSICPVVMQLICSSLIGTGFFGLFTIAQECARNTYLPMFPLLQEVLGAALMAPMLYSYENWRLQYISHTFFPNSEDDMTLLTPTRSKIASLGPKQLQLMRLITTTPLKFLSSIGTWLSSWSAIDLLAFPGHERKNMLVSWSIPLLFAGFIWPAMIASSGLWGWMVYWLFPWIVFHKWLTYVTLMRSVAPHVGISKNDDTFDQARAAVSGTVTCKLPRFMEVLINDANYQVPKLVTEDVPFYHAKALHAWLSIKLGVYMTESQLNAGLVLGLLQKWQVYDDTTGTYRTFSEVVRDIQLQQTTTPDSMATPAVAQ